MTTNDRILGAVRTAIQSGIGLGLTALGAWLTIKTHHRIDLNGYSAMIAVPVVAVVTAGYHSVSTWLAQHVHPAFSKLLGPGGLAHYGVDLTPIVGELKTFDPQPLVDKIVAGVTARIAPAAIALAMPSTSGNANPSVVIQSPNPAPATGNAPIPNVEGTPPGT